MISLVVGLFKLHLVPLMLVHEGSAALIMRKLHPSQALDEP